MVAAALAITFVIRNAPPKPAAEPPGAPQSAPDAAVQGINGDLCAHGADQLESAPDIARCDALEAQHDANQAQAAPDGTIANWRTVHP